MRMHVTRTVLWYVLRSIMRQLRQILRLVPAVTFQALVVALVHSQMDYSK